jgi:hypothetical protein
VECLRLAAQHIRLFSRSSQFYGSLDRLDSLIKIIIGSLERITLSCTSRDPVEMNGHSYDHRL